MQLIHFFKRLLMGVAFVLCVSSLMAQINYGTTGLMNMPTADMHRDKTVMLGGNWLSRHVTVPRWWYDTWNYYINVTLFPWFEAGYLCMGHKSVPLDYGHLSGYWPSSKYGKFTNQDRSFHFRLRLWKEGWWKSWTPQVALGANDVLGDSDQGGSITNNEGRYDNSYMTRYYLAITKHFNFSNLGTLGMHFSWIYGSRFDNDLFDPAVGVDFRFQLPNNGSFWRKALNSATLMAELVPGYTETNEEKYFDPSAPKYQVNLGLYYSFWKDYFNALVEWNKGKYWSAGVQFKLHLK